MSVLLLRLEGTEFAAEAAIAAEVLDTKLRTIAEFALSEHQEQEIEVEPGHYLIRAHLPSGEVIAEHTSIQAQERKAIGLTSPQASHQWLNWQYFLGNINGSKNAPDLAQFQSTWMRLWGFERGKWSLQALSLHELGRSKTMVNYRLQTRPVDLTQLRFLQVGGQDVPWQLIAIPPFAELEILVHPAPNNRLDSPLTVSIASHDWKAETLLKYLASGDLEYARVIGNDLWQDAESFFQGNWQHLMAVVITGYYLLRTDNNEQWQDWSTKIGSWFCWLPDVAVIQAWLLLRQPDNDRLELVREQLLQAAKAGIPLFSPGLRLLFDGLQLFHQDATRQGKKDKAITAALERIQPYAAAADWSQPLTAFCGETPSRPQLLPRVGVPQNQECLVWLVEPEANLSNFVKLDQWLQGIIAEGWQTVEEAWGGERARLVFSTRNVPPQSGVVRVKRIELQSQTVNEAVDLLVDFLPKPDSIAVRLQVHPIEGKAYLPPNLTVVVLDESGTEILPPQRTSRTDNRISIKLDQGSVGDQFSVQVSLGDTVAVQRFVL